jgi:hypothetical protein
MGKQALQLQRGKTTFLIDPHEVYLEERPGHKWYEPRVHDMPAEAEIAWALENWIRDEIELDPNEEHGHTCTEGRKRVRIGRAVNDKAEALGLPRRLLKATRVDHKNGLGWSIVKNHHRSKGEDPVTEAFKLRDYLGAGFSPADALVAFQWTSERTIANRQALLNLDQTILDAIRAGTVVLSKAMRWTGLPVKDQLAAFKAHLNPPAPKGPKIRKLTAAKAAKLLEGMADDRRTVEIRAVLAWAAGTMSEDQVAVASPTMAKALAALKPEAETEESTDEAA